MQCSCINIDVDAPMTMLKQKHFRASKDHVCSECGKTINKGERYLYEVGSYEGRLLYYKTCPDCESIRDAFFCNGWWFGNIRDDLVDHIDYMGGDISEDCISPLTPPARDFVCDRIEMYWRE